MRAWVGGVFVALMLLSAGQSVFADPLEPVRLQLLWRHQFQFAGYYMALEKGYYREAGLDVTLVEFDQDHFPVEEVLSGRAQFGVGRSSLLLERMRGKDLVALMAAFQRSPLMLLTTAASGIRDPAGLRDKRIMVSRDGSQVAEIMAMLLKYGITENDITIQPQSFDIRDLAEGRTDAVAAYISNEPYQLQQLGVGYNLIHPEDYGFPMYSDILFTSGRMVDEHFVQVNRFLDASRKGWRYAFDHIDETIDLILQRYNSQQRSREALLFEAQALRKLAFDDQGRFGFLNNERFDAMASVYRITNTIEPDFGLQGFLFCCAAKTPFNLSPLQRNYLRTLAPVRICVNREWMPLEQVTNGQYVGILADYIGNIFERLGLEYQVLGAGSWQEARGLLNDGRCDLIGGIMQVLPAHDPLHFSRPFFTTPIMAAVKQGASVAHPLLLRRAVGVLRRHDLDVLLLRRYPGLTVVGVESVAEGLRRVQEGELGAFIDTQATIVRALREMQITGLVLDPGLNDSWDFSFAAAPGNSKLIALLDRSIAGLGHAEREQIAARWLTVQQEVGIDKGVVRNLLIAVAFLFALLGYRYYLVSSHNRRLERIAREDRLTGIGNRHWISGRIDDAVDLALRSSLPLSLIYFDIDDFKRVNDRYGHAQGDQVLIEVAEVVRENIRRTDSFGRWGGEEFLILLQDTDADGAWQLAEKLREAVAARIEAGGEPVTCSFGVAQLRPGENQDQLVNRADKALYQAKNRGKNRSEIEINQLADKFG